MPGVTARNDGGTATLREKLRQALDEAAPETHAWLTEAQSYTKLMEDVGNAVRKLAPSSGWAYVEELFDDLVIYQVGGELRGTVYFKAPYSVEADGTVTLDAVAEVKKVVSYPAATGTESDDSQGAEFTETGELVEVGA